MKNVRLKLILFSCLNALFIAAIASAITDTNTIAGQAMKARIQPPSTVEVWAIQPHQNQPNPKKRATHKTGNQSLEVLMANILPPHQL